MNSSDESSEGVPHEIDLTKVVLIAFFAISFPLAVALEVYQSGLVTDELWSFTIFMRDPWLWPFLGVFMLLFVVAGLIITRRQRQSLRDELEEKYDPEAIEMSDETREALIEEYGSVRKGVLAFHEEIKDLETPEEIEEWVEEHDLK